MALVLPVPSSFGSRLQWDFFFLIVMTAMELSLSSSDYDNKLTHLDCDGDQPFFFPLFKSFLATYLVYCWFKLNHM
jgi:hypothetical protein